MSVFRHTCSLQKVYLQPVMAIKREHILIPCKVHLRSNVTQIMHTLAPHWHCNGTWGHVCVHLFLFFCLLWWEHKPEVFCSINQLSFSIFMMSAFRIFCHVICNEFLGNVIETCLHMLVRTKDLYLSNFKFVAVWSFPCRL